MVLLFVSYCVNAAAPIFTPSVWTLCVSACRFKARPQQKKAQAPLIGQLFQAWAGTAHRVAAVLKVRSNTVFWKLALYISPLIEYFDTCTPKKCYFQ